MGLLLSCTKARSIELEPKIPISNESKEEHHFIKPIIPEEQFVTKPIIPEEQFITKPITPEPKLSHLLKELESDVNDVIYKTVLFDDDYYIRDFSITESPQEFITSIFKDTIDFPHIWPKHSSISISSPLNLALYYKSHIMIIFLLNAGAKPDITTICPNKFSYYPNNMPNSILRLLYSPYTEKKHNTIMHILCNANNKSDISYIDPQGLTLLHHAILKLDIESIQLLLKEGINPNPLIHTTQLNTPPLTIINWMFDEFMKLHKIHTKLLVDTYKKIIRILINGGTQLNYNSSHPAIHLLILN